MKMFETRLKGAGAGTSRSSLFATALVCIEKLSFEQRREIAMHAEILEALGSLLRPAAREAARRQNVRHHFSKHRDLRVVHAPAQLGDAPHRWDVHPSDAQDVTCVDPRLDKVHRTAHRPSLEQRPFRHVHSAVSRQNAHVSVERPDSGHRKERCAQDTGTCMNGEIGLQRAYSRESLWLVEPVNRYERNARGGTD
jgi:hypothetical protein